MQYSLKILTNDPSITGWGWAVVFPNGQVQSCGCIKTSSENKVRRIRKGDDDVRRIGEIAEFLLSIINKHKVNLIVSELPHGSQNAAAAKMIGAVAALCQTLSICQKIPIEWFSEADAKKHLLNKKSATKEEVINAIKNHYEIPWTGVKYKDEGIADAMAIFHVARSQNSIIKMFDK